MGALAGVSSSRCNWWLEIGKCQRAALSAVAFRAPPCRLDMGRADGAGSSAPLSSGCTREDPGGACANLGK